MTDRDETANGGASEDQSVGAGDTEEAASPEEQLRAERDEYLDLAQRARAELENFRKRASTDSASAEKRGRAALAREVLPALDDLGRAILSAGISLDPAADEEAAKTAEVSATEAFAQGVALVYRELGNGLARAGITAFEPDGEKFDPTWHEAIATRPGEGASSGTVVEVLQRGYKLDDDPLRPARVIVAE